MRSPVAGIAALIALFVVIIIGYSCVFTVSQTEQVLVVRLGEPVRVVTEPGLNFKAPFIDTVISIDKRILDLENPSQEVIAFGSEAAGGRCLRPLSHQERAALLPERRLDPGRQHPAHDAAERGRCAACLARSPSSRWCATSAKP